MASIAHAVIWVLTLKLRLHAFLQLNMASSMAFFLQHESGGSTHGSATP